MWTVHKQPAFMLLLLMLLLRRPVLTYLLVLLTVLTLCQTAGAQAREILTVSSQDYAGNTSYHHPSSQLYLAQL